MLIKLVGCFGLNGPLRQYFSLYRGIQMRGRKEAVGRGGGGEKKFLNNPPAPFASIVGPSPFITQLS